MATARLLGINDLNDVFQECKQFSAKWDMIGLNLGIASTTIAIINRDNPNSCEQCMYQMLAKWLQRENEKCVPNWRSLCQSLCAEIGKSTSDQIAEKYCVTDYNEEKDLNDKEKAVSGAKHLQQEFKKLLIVAYHVISAVDVGLFKLCVNYFFSSEKQTTPQIQEQLTELDTIPTSLGVLNFLVRNNFIGYLNYKLLKEFQTMVYMAESEELDDVELVGSKKLRKLKACIEKYDTKHDEFILSVNFNTIIEVFKEYPALAPVSHIGLPEFKIHLKSPWKNKRVYEWTEFFESHLTWPPYLFVTEVSKSSIILTYAVLPIFVSSVVRDLTNPEVLRELEEIGVNVQLSKELIEINSLMSKPATIKQDYHKEEEKQTALSKQLSSSDGCVHVLGIKEHSSLTTRRSAMERLSDREYTLCTHKVTGKLSVIDILHLQVTEKQLRYAVSSSGKHESLFLAVKITTKTDLYETNLPEFDTSHKKESDQILKPSSIYEVARFFSLYDLQVTERQKIQCLSLVATSDPQFPIEMDPLKLLVSVIHNTESIQKGMEAELSRERELSETYKKRSLVMMRELHAKEMQIKRINVESQSVGVDDEALQPEEVLLEANDEHKGDKVEILLEVLPESQLAAKVAEERILTLTSHIRENAEEIRQLKEELHKKTKELHLSHDLTKKKQDKLDNDLYEAVKSRNVFGINILMNIGANPNKKHGWDQQTPLHLSSKSGHVDIVNALLSHGADIHVKNMYQQTPLHLSCESGHVDIVNVLLSHGADTHVKNMYQQTPLHLSCESGHVDIVNVLLSHGADTHVKNMGGLTPLYLSARDGHVDIVNALLSHGADTEVKDNNQQTPLHLSSASGHVDIVNMLLSHGADIHVKDGSQQTPLHLSSASGHVDIVNMLLSHGADIHVKDRFQETPLHWSSMYGRVAIVNMLLSHGADIHVKDGGGHSPLDLAHKGPLLKTTPNYKDRKRKVIEILERQEKKK